MAGDILDLLHIERPHTADWELPAFSCGIRREVIADQARVLIGRLRSRPLLWIGPVLLRG